VSVYPLHPAVEALLPLLLPHPAEFLDLHLAAVYQDLLHHPVIHHQADLLLLVLLHLDHLLHLLLPAEALLKQLTATPEAPHPEVTL